MNLRALIAVALVGLLALAAAGSAHAFAWDPATIVSASPDRREQADDSSQYAAIAGDGRFVAFQTRARNLFDGSEPAPPGMLREGGIFRYDLSARRLEPVAYGDLRGSTGALVTRGAHNPSLNADGRYVAFATGEQLAAGDANGNLNVYVRDMDVPIGSPGAFEVVSARDGSDLAASYAGAALSGASAARGTAISADSRRVVFRTTAASSLPALDSNAMPSQQLFVRDREARSTSLVTVPRDPPPPGCSATAAGGAVSAAAISADGSTVTWTGQNAPCQVGFLPGEIALSSDRYYLWRRITDGLQAETRRITGSADPDDPDCPSGSGVTFDPAATGPCYGPLTDREDANFDPFPVDPPALSGDGYAVAYLVNRPPRGRGIFTSTDLDLFVTDMRPGVSRKAGTVELTREAFSSVSPVSSVAMSSSGRRIAFTSGRTDFVLPSPRLVDPPPALQDYAELYVIDRERMEIERASRAFDGGEANQGAVEGLSISASGGRVAFVSTASNLFFGDSNGRDDAFVVTRMGEGSNGAGGSDADAGEAPVEAAGELGPVRQRLAISLRRRGRTMRVTVTTPGAGTVEARALARLRRAGGRARQRTLARAKRRVPAAGSVTLALRTRPALRGAVSRRRPLRARLRVTFAPASGGRTLSVRRTVHFPR